MNPRRTILLATALMALPALTLAQQTSTQRPGANAVWLTFGGGGTHTGARSGGAFTTGVSLQLRRLFVDVTPLDLILWSGDTYPYRSESIGGQSVCRDTRNGQFADSSQCVNVNADYAFTTDVVLSIPRSPVIVGAGIRYDRKENPWFGVVGVQRRTGTSGMWSIRVQAGPDYVAAIAGLAVELHRF